MENEEPFCPVDCAQGCFCRKWRNAAHRSLRIVATAYVARNHVLVLFFPWGMMSCILSSRYASAGAEIVK